MDPRDFQKLAAKLAAGTSAAEYRSSISRSYYAVFNAAAGWLRDMGLHVPRSAAAHGEVRLCLRNSGDPTVTEVAIDLDQLQSFRNRADYQMDRADIETQSNAVRASNTAKELIRKLDLVCSGPARTTIAATIAKWRKDNGYP